MRHRDDPHGDGADEQAGVQQDGGRGGGDPERLRGVAADDRHEEVAWLARKIAELRLFPGDTAQGARSMERSLLEAGGAVLLVSQFTLLADTRRGRRPSFTDAAPPDVAVPLLDALADDLRTRGIEVATGRFGAHMLVESENDGPVTIWLDSAGR